MNTIIAAGAPITLTYRDQNGTTRTAPVIAMEWNNSVLTNWHVVDPREAGRLSLVSPQNVFRIDRLHG